MKKIFLALFCVPVLLISCNDAGDGADDGTNQGDSLALDFADMTSFSLQDYDLDLEILLPEVASSTGSGIAPYVEHEKGDYLWYLSIGPRFNLIIEDFGKEMNKVKSEKERLSNLKDIFVIEYLVEEPKLIMYRRTLHKDQGGTKTYHCYGEVEVGGYNYVLKSEEEGGLKPIIEDMVMTIRSAKSLSEIQA